MEQNEEFDNWFKKWEEDNPKLAEWKKKQLQQLQKFYAFPQKVVVGMSDSDGNWTDIGTIAPKNLSDYAEQYSVGKGNLFGINEVELKESPGFLHQQLSATWDTSSTSIGEYDKSFQEMLWKVGHHQTAPVWDKMKNQMPEMNQMVECPGGFGACWWTSSVWSMVQHLNDSHRWSREAIADWLEESGNNPEFPTPDDVPKEPGEE
jgi:hypothetical protein